ILGLPVTGVLNPHSFPWVHQGQSRNHHRLLHAADNHHLIGIAPDSSEVAQIAGDRLAKLKLAMTGSVTQEMSTLTSENARPQFFPGSKREFINRRNSSDQQITRWPTHADVELRSTSFVRQVLHAVRNPSLRLWGRLAICWARAQKVIRKEVGHESA